MKAGQRVILCRESGRRWCCPHGCCGILVCAASFFRPSIPCMVLGFLPGLCGEIPAHPCVSGSAKTEESAWFIIFVGFFPPDSFCGWDMWEPFGLRGLSLTIIMPTQGCKHFILFFDFLSIKSSSLFPQKNVSNVREIWDEAQHTIGYPAKHAWLLN